MVLTSTLFTGPKLGLFLSENWYQSEYSWIIVGCIGDCFKWIQYCFFCFVIGRFVIGSPCRKWIIFPGLILSDFLSSWLGMDVVGHKSNVTHNNFFACTWYATLKASRVFVDWSNIPAYFCIRGPRSSLIRFYMNNDFGSCSRYNWHDNKVMWAVEVCICQ